jgi:hypothetical protein
MGCQPGSPNIGQILASLTSLMREHFGKGLIRDSDAIWKVFQDRCNGREFQPAITETSLSIVLFVIMGI